MKKEGMLLQFGFVGFSGKVLVYRFGYEYIIKGQFFNSVKYFIIDVIRNMRFVLRLDLNFCKLYLVKGKCVQCRIWLDRFFVVFKRFKKNFGGKIDIWRYFVIEIWIEWLFIEFCVLFWYLYRYKYIYVN